MRDIVNSSGTDVATIQYDAFGNQLSVTSPGSAVPDPQNYVGRYTYDSYDYDATTGYYDNNARVYDPGSGRWLSQDPEGFAAGDNNLYRYVNNSPINASDPSGMQPGGGPALERYYGKILGPGPINIFRKTLQVIDGKTKSFESFMLNGAKAMVTVVYNAKVKLPSSPFPWANAFVIDLVTNGPVEDCHWLQFVTSFQYKVGANQNGNGSPGVFYTSPEENVKVYHKYGWARLDGFENMSPFGDLLADSVRGAFPAAALYQQTNMEPVGWQNRLAFEDHPRHWPDDGFSAVKIVFDDYLACAQKIWYHTHIEMTFGPAAQITFNNNKITGETTQKLPPAGQSNDLLVGYKKMTCIDKDRITVLNPIPAANR